MNFGRTQQDDDNGMIRAFLAECLSKGFELDYDDIEHILNLDFDYVRKQHIVLMFCQSCGKSSETAYYEDDKETKCECGSVNWSSDKVLKH